MMRTVTCLLVASLLASPIGAADRLKVISTLTDYASVAQLIGGDKVESASIARGYQDAHFVSAKPSFARQLSTADLFLTTGMDLELWVPNLMDKSRNRRIREGEPGYVSVSRGVNFLQIPQNPSRSAGDTHVYGNPHIITDPLRGIQIAENIKTGLTRVDPANASSYQAGFLEFKAEIYLRLFGTELVEWVGGDQLAQLSRNHRLDPFLDNNQIGGNPLRDSLGGWLKEAECLQGTKIIAYHKNWIYFTDRFGINIVDYVEHRPGIPPTARHVVELIDKIQTLEIKAILTANYFDTKAPRMIEEKTGAKALIVPLSVEGTPEAQSYFDLFGIWIQALKSVHPECG
ncbi:MAG: metal ABC transporter substrate-binding protein [Acidobacteriota bacterium]